MTMRATWRSDRECTRCELCRQSFTLLRRRHHCRRCGGLFCSRCASAQVSGVPGYATTERVCTPCGAILRAGAHAHHPLRDRGSFGESSAAALCFAGAVRDSLSEVKAQLPRRPAGDPSQSPQTTSVDSLSGVAPVSLGVSLIAPHPRDADAIHGAAAGPRALLTSVRSRESVDGVSFSSAPGLGRGASENQHAKAATTREARSNSFCNVVGSKGGAQAASAPSCGAAAQSLAAKMMPGYLMCERFAIVVQAHSTCPLALLLYDAEKRDTAVASTSRRVHCDAGLHGSSGGGGSRPSDSGSRAVDGKRRSSSTPSVSSTTSGESSTPGRVGVSLVAREGRDHTRHGQLRPRHGASVASSVQLGAGVPNVGKEGGIPATSAAVPDTTSTKSVRLLRKALRDGRARATLLVSLPRATAAAKQSIPLPLHGRTPLSKSFGSRQASSSHQSELAHLSARSAESHVASSPCGVGPPGILELTYRLHLQSIPALSAGLGNVLPQLSVGADLCLLMFNLFDRSSLHLARSVHEALFHCGGRCPMVAYVAVVIPPDLIAAPCPLTPESSSPAAPPVKSSASTARPPRELNQQMAPHSLKTAAAQNATENRDTRGATAGRSYLAHTLPRDPNAESVPTMHYSQQFARSASRQAATAAVEAEVTPSVGPVPSLSADPLSKESIAAAIASSSVTLKQVRQEALYYARAYGAWYRELHPGTASGVKEAGSDDNSVKQRYPSTPRDDGATAPAAAAVASGVNGAVHRQSIYAIVCELVKEMIGAAQLHDLAKLHTP